MVTRDNLILIKRVKSWGSKLRVRGGGAGVGKGDWSCPQAPVIAFK